MKDLKIRIPFTDEYIENFLLKNDIKASTNSSSIEMILIYDSGKIILTHYLIEKLKTLIFLILFKKTFTGVKYIVYG